jgi:hypothetical protein
MGEGKGQILTTAQVIKIIRKTLYNKIKRNEVRAKLKPQKDEE